MSATWSRQLEAFCEAFSAADDVGEDVAGVYFVVRADRVLYVGQSGTVRARCAIAAERFGAVGLRFFVLRLRGPMADHGKLGAGVRKREELEAAFIALFPCMENVVSKSAPAWAAAVAYALTGDVVRPPEAAQPKKLYRPPEVQSAPLPGRPPPRQMEVLRFVAKSIECGLPPTIREICEELGTTSTNGANDHLRYLEVRRLITRQENRARSIRITDLGWNLLASEAVPTEAA